MTTWNLDAPSLGGAALALEVVKTKQALRWERHYNVLAQSGLAVGDTVIFNITMPEWCRTIVVGKRTNTANADVLSVICVEPNLTTPIYLPIKTANSVQVGGSTYSGAASEVLMQLFPMGDSIQVQCQIATSVPTQFMLSVALYDA